MKLSHPLLLTVLAASIGCSAPQRPSEPRQLVAITLTSQGVEPFPQGEVNRVSLEETYSGYTVDASKDGNTFAVRDEGNTVLYVEKAGEGVRVKVRGETVLGPRDIHVGSAFDEVAALEAVQCRRGSAPWSDQAFCTSDNLENIVFAFDIEGIATPGCTDSCRIEDITALADAKVTSMDWQP